MKQMTKNEYQAYMQECATRVYVDPDYSMEDFDSDLNNVEVLPFNLSAFPKVTEATARWINIFFLSEDADRNGNYILRGRTYHESNEMKALNLHYGDYDKSLSFWGYNDEEYLIYTYCEGDTTLTILPDKESYEKEKKDTLKWYKEAAS